MPVTATATSATDTLRQEVRVGEHRLATDEPAGLGGDDTAPTPYDLLAAAVAACVATTLRAYARRKGWPLGALSVAASFEGDPHDARCTIELELPEDLEPARAARLRRVAAACPVHRTLVRGVTFTHAAPGPAVS